MVDSSLSREDFLQALVSALIAKAGRSRMRVAINGVDGAGKTRLADDLANTIGARGRSVVRASIDGFLLSARSSLSAGSALSRRVLSGLFQCQIIYRQRAQATSPEREAADTAKPFFDHRTDSEVRGDTKQASSDAIAIIDGIFLFAHELRSYWGQSLFLEVPFKESFRRMAVRDNSDPNPLAQSSRRYRDGQLLYLAECHPKAHANIVIDYANFERPRILKLDLDARVRGE